MAGTWDTAEMLLAMAGDAEDAAAVARGMAEDCRRSRRRREAAFWSEVALAVVWLANPQPMIAPRAPPEGGAAVLRLPHGPRRAGKASAGATVHRLRFAARLPRRRGRILRITKELRELLERQRRETLPSRRPKADEPGEET